MNGQAKSSGAKKRISVLAVTASVAVVGVGVAGTGVAAAAASGTSAGVSHDISASTSKAVIKSIALTNLTTHSVAVDLTGTVIDPAAPHPQIMVDWGDGTPNTFFTSVPTSPVPHDFPTSGPKIVAVFLYDDDSIPSPPSVSQAELGFTMFASPKAAVLTDTASGGLGVTLDAGGTWVDPQAALAPGFSASIDWGTGTPTPIAFTANGFPTQSLYTDTETTAGTYTPKIVIDYGLGIPGSTASASGTAVTVTTPVPPPPPVPTPTPTPTVVHRIGGGDRYQTAQLVSQAQWKDGSADAVVLARGDQAPDALAGVPLAAHVHGPLLLTNPLSMDRATSMEIARVTGGPSPDKTVYILGGASAISPTIEAGLRAAGYHVVRYEGTDRFGTALKIASAFGTTSHVIVATGENFPDALAAGPLGAVENAPIVLSNDDTFDPATAAFVESHAAIDPVGGFAQRAVATLNTTGKTVNYGLSGMNRYQTAESVADAIVHVTGHAPTSVGIASGVTFPDALTGGAYAANAGIPLLITNSGALPEPTRLALLPWVNTLKMVTVFGGTQAVSDGVLGEIAFTVRGKIQ